MYSIFTLCPMLTAKSLFYQISAYKKTLCTFCLDYVVFLSRTTPWSLYTRDMIHTEVINSYANAPEVFNTKHASFLNDITSLKNNYARLLRTDIRDAAVVVGGYNSTADALSNIGQKTAIAHIAGGAATRWDKSFGDSSEYYNQGCLALRGEPRGFARVPNLLRHEGVQGESVPVFLYSLWATRHIPTSQRYIIHPENASDEELYLMDSCVKKLGLQAHFRPQKLRGTNPKPSGHADAIAQHPDILGDDIEYFVPQFVSDASSPSTITDTLLVLHAAKKAEIPIDMLAPTAQTEGKYPFFVNTEGLPVKIGHAKLLGDLSLISEDLTPAESSVGLYLFSADAFREKMNESHTTYLDSGENSYAFLPGHRISNGRSISLTNEFAVDDIVTLLMAESRARLLAIAQPREILHSAKTVTELVPFTEMMKEIIDDERSRITMQRVQL